MTLRFALPVMLLALPATGETIEAQFACTFSERCEAETCTPVEPLAARLRAEKGGDAYLALLPGTMEVAMDYEMTPRGTLMANGMQDDVTLLLSVGPEGDAALARLSPGAGTARLNGRCE